jgi:hypothetical protein
MVTKQVAPRGPHARRDVQRASWDKVRQLRKDIQTLETGVDRLLQALES